MQNVFLNRLLTRIKTVAVPVSAPGVSGELTVELPKENKFTEAMPVNLRGEKTGESIQIRDAKLTFELGAYAPVSFVLE